MDKIRIQSKIWALELDIKCLRTLPDSNSQKAKSIRALELAIERLKEEHRDVLSDKPVSPT